MNYSKAQTINWRFGLIIAVTFVVGGFVGSKIALKINPAYVKLIFGVLMAYVSIRMMMSGINTFSDES